MAPPLADPLLLMSSLCFQSPRPWERFADADPALPALLTAMVRRKYPAGGTRNSE